MGSSSSYPDDGFAVLQGDQYFWYDDNVEDIFDVGEMRERLERNEVLVDHPLT